MYHGKDNKGFQQGQANLNSSTNANHQNININISYNLNTHKIPKGLLAGKKVSSKSHKVKVGDMHPQHIPEVNQKVSQNVHSKIPSKSVLRAQKVTKKSKQICQTNSSQEKKTSKLKKQKKSHPNASSNANKNSENVDFTFTNQKFLTSSIKEGVNDYYNPFANNSKEFRKRDITSPDFTVEQRKKLKTEGSFADNAEYLSTFKKDKGAKKKSSISHGAHLRSFQFQPPNTQSNERISSNCSNLNTIVQNNLHLSTSKSKVTKKSSIINSSNLYPKPKKSQSHTKKSNPKAKRIHTLENQRYYNFDDDSHLRSREEEPSSHFKSCMFYSSNKNKAPSKGIMNGNGNQHLDELISGVPHVTSTNYADSLSRKVQNRKRVQSAHGFKNEKKLVTKLLNMSLLSDVGSSQIVSTETRSNVITVDQLEGNSYRKEFVSTKPHIIDRTPREKAKEQPMPHKALRQFLSSIDMRVIQKMEDDVHPRNHSTSASKQQKSKESQTLRKRERHLPLIDYLVSVKGVSMHKIVESAKVIQNFFRENVKKQQKKMMNFYGDMFKNILSQGPGSLLNNAVDTVSINFSSSLANKSDNKSSLLLDVRKKKKQKTAMEVDSVSQNLSENQSQERSKQQSQNQEGFKLNFNAYKKLVDQQIKRKEIINEVSEGHNRRNLNKAYQSFISENELKNSEQVKQKSEIKQQGQRSEEILKENGEKDLFDQTGHQCFEPETRTKGKEQSNLSSQKQSQVEQWNNINRLLTNTLNRKAAGHSRNFSAGSNGSGFGSGRIKLGSEKQGSKFSDFGSLEGEAHQIELGSEDHMQSTDPMLITQQNELLLKELMEQSELNKRWIQEQEQQNEEEHDSKDPDSPFAENLENQHKKIEGRHSRGKGLGKKSKKKMLIELSNQSDQEISWQYSEEFKKRRQEGDSLERDMADDISEDEHESEFDSKKYSVDSNEILLRKGSEELSDNNEGSSSTKKQQRFSDERWIDQSQRLIENLQKQQSISNNIKHNVSLFNDLESEKGLQERQNALSEAERVREVKKLRENLQGSNGNYLECELSGFVHTSNKQPLPLNLRQIESYSQSVEISVGNSSDNNIVGHEQEESLSDSSAGLAQLRNAVEIGEDVEEISVKEQFERRIKQANQELNRQKRLQEGDGIDQEIKKKVGIIVEDMILDLIREFARDISLILKRSSSYKMDEASKRKDQLSQEAEEYANNFNFSVQVRSNHTVSQPRRKKGVDGVDTSNNCVQEFLNELISFILADPQIVRALVSNINKDIGPDSLQILSYLRPVYEEDDTNQYLNGDSVESESHSLSHPHEEPEVQEDEEGLFVIPTEIFEVFQEKYIQKQISKESEKQVGQNVNPLNNRQRAFLNFWHRSIFESYNEYLDYQRPYGVNGKPYDWSRERKKFREVKEDDVASKLREAVQKQMEAMKLPSGIIYDKHDLPEMYRNLGDEEKMVINEERLSRLLAIELFEAEESWYNFTDESTELLVEISRMIEEEVFFELGSQLMKLKIKRKSSVATENTAN